MRSKSIATLGVRDPQTESSSALRRPDAMYMPKFELLSFASLPVQRKQIVLRAALEFLIVADWNYLIDNPGMKSLYESAPHYVLKVRPGGLDAWQDIPQTIALGSGDCKDFACWRVAELRNAGYDDVYPHIKVSYHEDPNGRDPMMTVYHIQVRIHDVIEDPSAILGMPKNVTYEQLKGEAPQQMPAQEQFDMAAGLFNQVPAGPYSPIHNGPFAPQFGYGGYGYAPPFEPPYHLIQG
jgi:hypothetical protein